MALVEEAKALLAHALPSADLAEIHLRALRTLVAALKKRKFAQVTPPAAEQNAIEARTSAHRRPNPDAPRFPDEPTESPRQRGRYVPAAVRRAVFERDGKRCAYVDARGARCRETSKLELHHHEPFARGGPSTRANLSLYCAAHNALAAEDDFGPAFAVARREHPHLTERSLTREVVTESPTSIPSSEHLAEHD